MIDPSRLTDDRQTTPFELELLRAAQQDVLVPGQRARMLGGLGVIGFPQAPSAASGQLGAGQAGLTTAGSSAVAVSGGMSGLLGKVLSAKGVLSATLLGTLALVTVARVSEPPRPAVVAQPAPVQLEAAPVQLEVAPANMPVAEKTAQASAAEALGDVGSVPARAPSLRQETSEKSSLARELALIEAARGALLENRPRVTLSRLDAYRSQFPHGRLATESSMLRLEALVAVGDRAGAQRIGTRLLRNAPNSPYSPRIRSLLGDAVIPAKSE